MNNLQLDGLLQAFAQGSENAALARVLLGSLLEQGGREYARRFLDLLPGGLLSDENDRIQVARVCLVARTPEAALAHLDGARSGEALLVKARALLDLDRRAEARSVYDAAIAGNVALEDPAFEALLGSQVRSVEGGGRTPLRVLAGGMAGTGADTSFVPEQPKVTFADVGGLAALKKQVHKKIVLPYQKPGLFLRFRKRAGGGILMYGPPGCGKTLLARATAGECNARFLNVAISDILDMWIGESEQKLHAVFERAREAAPAVLFFDELEALGGRRQHARDPSSAKLVSQFLAEMDGFAQNNHGVLILAATNLPWAVDPAFRRPGRFDRVLFVPPPDREAREAILRIHLDGRPGAESIATGDLAAMTSGFSGADLLNLVETAAEEAIGASLDAGRELALTPAHFRAALAEVRPTTAEWLTSARNYARYANEGGHYDDVLEFLERHGKKS